VAPVALVLATLCVHGAIVGARRLSDRGPTDEEVGAAWSELSRCLLGDAVGTQQDFTRQRSHILQQRAIELADQGGKWTDEPEDAAASWPRQCAPLAATLYDLARRRRDLEEVAYRALLLHHELAPTSGRRRFRRFPWHLADLVEALRKTPLPLTTSARSWEVPLATPLLSEEELGGAHCTTDKPPRAAKPPGADEGTTKSADPSEPSARLRLTGDPYNPDYVLVRQSGGERVEQAVAEDCPLRGRASLESGWLIEFCAATGQLRGAPVPPLPDALAPPVSIGRLPAPLLGSRPEYVNVRFHGCRLGDRYQVAIEALGLGAVALTTLSQGSWSPPRLVDGHITHLSCRADQALLLGYLPSIFPNHQLVQLRCGPKDCQRSTLALSDVVRSPDAMPDSHDGFAAVPIGDQVLLVWLPAYLSPLMRLAKLEDLAQAPTSYLARGIMGPYSADGSRLEVHGLEDHAVVSWRHRGRCVAKVSADGSVEAVHRDSWRRP